MRIEKSLLTKQQSLWMKGIIILLIVLGHNSVLMGTYSGMEKRVLYDFLYCFHVYLFFFIRALYDWKPLNGTSVKKSFLKLYKPYTICFFIVLAISIVMGFGFAGVKSLVIAFITGSDSLLKKTIGMSFLWFLPTMFSFIVLIGLYAKRIKWVNVIILVVSFSVVIYSTLKPYTLFKFDKYFICGSLVAIRAFGLCVICRWLFERFHESKSYRIFIPLATLVEIVVYVCFRGESRVLGKILTFGLMPFFMFQFVTLLTYRIERYSNIVIYLGRHSLEIYLIHIILYNMMLVGVSRMHIEPTLWLGIGLYMVTILLTLLVNYIFARCLPAIYKFIFSQEYKSI